MSRANVHRFVFAFTLIVSSAASSARADGDLRKVNHIIVVMQENHSFDNYFGALAYAPDSPYHRPRPGDGDHEGGHDDGDHDRDDNQHGCRPDDHRCVDGLSCARAKGGELTCFNANLDADDGRGRFVLAFHDTRRCVAPDLDHSWAGTHHEVNFGQPNRSLADPRNDGFVRVNDVTEQIDTPGGESPTEDQTMNFYDQREIPFYYDLAQNFAISDRYFSSVLGPTFPNRSYLLAATSFGHLTTSDSFPPPGSTGYRPITGTIFDLLDQAQVTWADYFSDVPQGGSFRPFSATAVDPHFLPVSVFLAQAAGTPGFGSLPQVVFVDPNFGVLNPLAENDEHPPTDIRRGQGFVSQIVNAVRNGPAWNDSIIVITYDEHGGSYDHVAPPRAPQGGARTPDGISPGQCADRSNVPASLQPGGGAECSTNLLSATDTTVANAIALCPALASSPTGPFPDSCASFDQLGVRVPLLAVSPFSKRRYVSHTVGDHTSLLALIEKRFLTSAAGKGGTGEPAHLTKRDQHANTLEDLFDFDRAPSRDVPVTKATPPTPAEDCSFK
jgi:phospholipase C